MTLVEFLEHEIGLSSERARELVNLGAVYVDDERAREAALPLRTGAHVRVHLQPRRFEIGSLRANIRERHGDYYIVDKPARIPTHALVDNAEENLIAALGRELEENLFITHRLDVETAGLILIARTSEAARRLNALIAAKTIKRFYKAWVATPVSSGRYVHYLEPSPKAPKRVSTDPNPEWKRCELEVLSCRESKFEAKPAFELEIELLTGRSQQIRAQLSALGSPIIGDTQYGSRVALEQKRAIALRADRLVFTE